MARFLKCLPGIFSFKLCSQKNVRDRGLSFKELDLNETRNKFSAWLFLKMSDVHVVVGRIFRR